MKKIDKLTALDAAIKREPETVQTLETNLQRTREEKAQAEAEQKRLAYRALAENDPDATQRLQECEETLAKFNAHVQSCESALQTGRDKLEALHEDRQQNFLAAQRHEYAAQCVELLKVNAEELESALSLMTAAREAIGERLRRMEAIGLEAGLDTSHTHTRIRENLRHAVELRGQFASVWMARDVRETFKQPISALLQQTLKSLIPEIEDQERKIA